MNVIATLIWRNMLLFFKNKTSVFFAFMAVFVVLFLYICFLGEFMITPLKQGFPETARELSDTWIMAGTLGIVALTSSLSVLGIVIEDKSNRVLQDFSVSPIAHWQITLAYLLSTVIITFLISLVTLVIAESYIVLYGGEMLNILAFVKVLGIMLISITSCTSMLYFMMSWFESATSFSNVTTIIGTLSGFFMGIYVPIGSLPGFLQTIIMWFPPSHGAALFREVMMQDVLQRSFLTEQSAQLTAFKEQFGLVFTYGDHVSGMLDHILVVVATGLFFLLLNTLIKKRKACRS